MKNQLSTQILHWVRVSMYESSTIFRKHWFVILATLVAGYILVVKDFAFSFKLTNSEPQAVTHQPMSNVQPTAQKEQAPPTPKVDVQTAIKSDEYVSLFELTNFIIAEINTAQETSNRGNSFSNIGFVLNPGLAKKRGIDPAIVAEKQRIVSTYLSTFAPIAISEMEKHGVPASITLAQGLLESDAGKSRLARNNNNHFGVKCFSKHCKKGHCVNYTDDSHKDFFRNYQSAWQSYRAHSLFLRKPRYSKCFNYKTTDYKQWAKCLRASGYATDKRYADKLIKIIEVMKLYEYDKN